MEPININSGEDIFLPSALQMTISVKSKKIFHKTFLLSLKNLTHSFMQIKIRLKRVKIHMTFLVMWGEIKLV